MATRLTKSSKYLFNLLKSSNKTIKINNFSSLSSILVLNQRTNYKLAVADQLNRQQQMTVNSKRFYSAEQSSKQAEVEEKVLNIFKNFDRIKENPAKPTVSKKS